MLIENKGFVDHFMTIFEITRVKNLGFSSAFDRGTFCDKKYKERVKGQYRLESEKFFDCKGPTVDRLKFCTERY